MADVILIDDDPDIRALASMALELDDNVVEATGDGHAGLELLDRMRTEGRRPVVVLDVEMPAVDGWTVLGLIRAEADRDDVPVVMCTVRAGGLDRERGYGLGADAYEPKPFDLDGLMGTVARLAAMPRDDLLANRDRLARYIAEVGELPE